MQIINVFLAIIIAIGFWRFSNKEQDLKTKKSSCTKTFIIFLLTVGLTYFYIKTYQVATFKNDIIIKGLKGSYDTINKQINLNGEVIDIRDIIAYDRVHSLILLNCFSYSKYDIGDPQWNLSKGRKQSGLIVTIELAHRGDRTKEFHYSPKYIPNNIDSLKYIYDVDLVTNTIPSIFPFSTYEEKVNKELFEDEIKSSVENIHRKGGKIGKEYDRLFFTRLVSYGNDRFITERTFSEHINTLNFFSAADLSQCNYMLDVRSDIPIDNFKVCFDIPVEVSSADINNNKFDSREFTVDLKGELYSNVNKFALYHIKFPTLANLQLIRSLILTTLLTALLSLFFTNLYYLLRKLHKGYIKKNPISYIKRKEIVLLWIPVGKIIVWSIIILFIFGLILSMSNNSIWFNSDYIILSKIIIFLCVILYIIIVSYILFVLYKRGIYLKKIKQHIISCLNDFELKMKDYINKKTKHIHIDHMNKKRKK